MIEEAFGDRVSQETLQELLPNYREMGDAKIKDFEANAIAILFPYIRAIISTYTANANVAPVIIPPMNINVYLRKKYSEENKQV